MSGGLAFANAGGIVNPSTKPATQIATLSGITGAGGSSTSQALAPDASLQRAFYPAINQSNPILDRHRRLTAYDISAIPHPAPQHGGD